MGSASGVRWRGGGVSIWREVKGRWGQHLACDEGEVGSAGGEWCVLLHVTMCRLLQKSRRRCGPGAGWGTASSTPTV